MLRHHRLRALTTVSIVFAVLFSATAAHAEPATVTYLGLGPGYADVYDPGTGPEDAGSYRFEIDGQEVLAYCADVTLDLNDTASFSLIPAADSAVPNVGAAAWVAVNAATIGTPLADADSETAAVQLAVWSRTNSITVDPATVAYEPIRTRALELISAIGANTLPSGPTTFKGTLEATVVAGTATLTATITEDDNTPIPDVAVDFTAGSATGSATTGPDGRATWSTPAPTEALPVQAEATTSIPAGSVLLPNDGSQPLITAAAVPVSLSTGATVDPSVPTTTSPAPTTTAAVPTTTPAAPETTTPAPPAEELPYTGASLGLWHLLAALGALGAAGAFIIRFRRQGL